MIHNSGSCELSKDIEWTLRELVGNMVRDDLAGDRRVEKSLLSRRETCHCNSQDCTDAVNKDTFYPVAVQGAVRVGVVELVMDGVNVAFGLTSVFFGLRGWDLL